MATTDQDDVKQDTKGGKVPKEGKAERKRLTYLKARSKELKSELEAVKKEAMELRVKLGMDKKQKGAKAETSEE
ncbi:MAG TPA: hypothetical protein VG819_05690 [Rhizomicrobium sp.]|jgi:hypothetical protein|nr:hypothetical protein [Rhizomicrobium sp.]